MKDTTSTYWVQACMYQKRNCIDQWEMLLTMYGYCLQLKPARQELSAGDTGKNNVLIAHVINLWKLRYERWRSNCITFNCFCI